MRLQEAEARAHASELARELAAAQGAAAELRRALAAQGAERRGAERRVKDAEVRLAAALAARQRDGARADARIQARAPATQTMRPPCERGTLRRREGACMVLV